MHIDQPQLFIWSYKHYCTVACVIGGMFFVLGSVTISA
ncbi:hypothetical protein PBOI14_35670 [Pseudomonas sp. Boi14]|nr:hypothetical protein PBOI14_35670 [Pseudomonas sp. Boi14]